jgi:DNA-binding transcriptional LysR family regulator
MNPASWRILRHFLAVYDAQGFSAGAAEINISQPAITRSIRFLESQLDVVLFERSPKGATPTRYADILARRLRLMDIEYRYALSEIEAAKGGSDGLIRVGAGPAWYSTLLPPIVRDFVEKYPGIKFRIEAGIISNLIPKLEAGEYDVVCTSLDFPNNAHLVKEPTLEVRHNVVAATDHPLTRVKQVKPADLAAFPWVTIADDHIATGRILSYFAGFDCPAPKVMIETSSFTALNEFVALGQYLAHMPQVILPNVRRLGIVPLAMKGTFWETSAGIIYRQSQYRPEPLVRFIEQVRAHFKGSGGK